MGSRDADLSRLGRRIAEEEADLIRRRLPEPRARERFVTAALALHAARGSRSGALAAARTVTLLAAVVGLMAIAFFVGRYRSGAQPAPLEVRPDEARLAPPTVVTAGAAPVEADSATPAPPRQAPTAIVPTPSGLASARAPTLPLPPPRPSWRDLVAGGRFKEALEAVDREGFARLCAEGTAADLRDLGDAARLSGDPARAVTALTTLRRRFPGDEQAAEAAFLLGLMAAGDPSAHAEAARWFTTYLSERPQGRLAREASGRLLEAAARSGDRAAAREAARRYLKAFPGGPHAEMAQAILRE